MGPGDRFVENCTVNFPPTPKLGSRHPAAPGHAWAEALAQRTVRVIDNARQEAEILILILFSEPFAAQITSNTDFHGILEPDLQRAPKGRHQLMNRAKETPGEPMPPYDDMTILLQAQAGSICIARALT